MLTFAITSRRRGASLKDQTFYASADDGARRELAQRGALRAAFRRIDGRGHVLLLETETKDAARRMLEAYPSVATEVTRFCLVVVQEPVDRPSPDHETGSHPRKNGAG